MRIVIYIFTILIMSSGCKKNNTDLIYGKWILNYSDNPYTNISNDGKSELIFSDKDITFNDKLTNKSYLKKYNIDSKKIIINNTSFDYKIRGSNLILYTDIKMLMESNDYNVQLNTISYLSK